MKHYIFCILLSLSILSCDNSTKIRLTKLEGSPAYETAKLENKSINFDDKDHLFQFDVIDYELGKQTEKEFGFDLKGYGLKRIYGFLAERFMSFWFKKYTKYKTLPIVFKDLQDFKEN